MRVSSGCHRGMGEILAAVTAQLSSQYTHVLSPSGTIARRVLPRAAGIAGADAITEVTAIHSKVQLPRFALRILSLLISRCHQHNLHS